MKKMHFNLLYSGEALDNHEISARNLSDALIAMDGLLSESNKILNGEKVKVCITVKASFKSGSFGIDFAIVQSFIDTALSVLGGTQQIYDAKTILGILLGGGGLAGGAVGFVELLKLLKGQRSTKITAKEDGSFIIYIGDKYIKVEKEVMELYKNHVIRQNFEKLVAPIKQEGIDSVSFIKDKKVVSEINKSERAYFDCPKFLNEKCSESRYEVGVTVIRPYFKEDKKWYVDDGQSSFYVVIEDEVFLRKIDEHKEVFGKGDILRVIMRKEQYYTETESKLKSEHFIEKVIDKIQPPIQNALFNRER